VNRPVWRVPVIAPVIVPVFPPIIPGLICAPPSAPACGGAGLQPGPLSSCDPFNAMFTALNSSIWRACSSR